MALLATTIAVAGAAVLLWAALEKARNPAATASTLHQLGVPHAVAAIGAGLVTTAEAAVGLGLLYAPDSIFTQGGLVTLAGTFALAGLLALRRGVLIRCTCFGPGRGSYLGRRQVVAFAPWAAAAALLHVADAPPASEPSVTLAVICMTMAVLRLVPVVGVWWEARGDRRSARETYGWLRR